MKRTEIIKNLREYYLENLAENPFQWTKFDEKIIYFLNDLYEEWKFFPHGPKEITFDEKKFKEDFWKALDKVDKKRENN